MYFSQFKTTSGCVIVNKMVLLLYLILVMAQWRVSKENGLLIVLLNIVEK